MHVMLLFLLLLLNIVLQRLATSWHNRHPQLNNVMQQACVAWDWSTGRPKTSKTLKNTHLLLTPTINISNLYLNLTIWHVMLKYEVGIPCGLCFCCQSFLCYTASVIDFTLLSQSVKNRQNERHAPFMWQILSHWSCFCCQERRRRAACTFSHLRSHWLLTVLSQEPSPRT